MGFKTYDLGQKVKVTAEFTDPENSHADIDPDDVYLLVKPPTGSTITYHYGVDAEITRDSEGHYSAEIDANQPGDWFYRWKSTGDGQAAEENRFKVKPAEAT